jgi:quinol monooxygenase YgiN
MKIAIAVFEVEPDTREAFLAARHESMRLSRAEDGCVEFLYSADPLEAGRVVLFECWESQEHLDAHVAGLATRPKQPDAAPMPAPTSIVIYESVEQRRTGGA